MKNKVLDSIATKILNVQKQTPILICIDGVDGSGKTFFAEKLASKLLSLGENVVLCSVDDFHNSKEIRYKQGKNSPNGFYHNSYNYPELISKLLNPFKLGYGFYVEAIFDVDTDMEKKTILKKVQNNHILIVEGIFLQRPQLVDFWDVKLFLDVDFETTLNRTINRSKDIVRIGSKSDIELRYRERYIPGQKLYFKESNPKINADIVIDNSDYTNPFIFFEKK